jgi:hypothetical protein
MSKSPLETLNNSNVNVSLGTLYLFPVEQSELKAQGIEKQWFLTHQKGDRLLSGHINKENQWSLCNPKDLTPTYNYYEADELWELLGDDDFVAGLNWKTEVDSKNQPAQKRKILDSDQSNNEDEPWSDSIKLDKLPVKEDSFNLNKTPLSSFFKDEELEEEQELEIEKVERESENQISEEQRLLLEQDLQIILWEGYKADLLEFDGSEADEPWNLKLDSDLDLIKLISTADRHTVLAINLKGEIKEYLSLADAQLLIDKSALEKQQNQWDLFNHNDQEKRTRGLEID